MKVTKSDSWQSCKQKVQDSQSSILVTPSQEILAKEVVVHTLYSNVLKIIGDIAVDIVNNSHVPGNTEDDDDLFDDLDDITDHDDVINFVLVDVDVVF